MQITSFAGQPFDPLMPITNAVSNVICALAFGHRFSVQDEEFLKLMDAIRTTLHFGSSLFHGVSSLFPSYLVGQISLFKTLQTFYRSSIGVHMVSHLSLKLSQDLDLVFQSLSLRVGCF